MLIHIMRDRQTMENKHFLHIYSELERVHCTYYSDLRFGQFIFSFFQYVQNIRQRNLLFADDNELIVLLKEYCGENTM